jgi:hypothetical protein
VFFPGAVFEMRVSNDGNPLTDELVYQFVFSDPDRFQRQTVVMFEINVGSGRRRMVARGLTGRNLRVMGGGMVRAGIQDDPFFFDALAFARFRSAVQSGLPLADRVAPFLPPSIPNNFFGNFNVLAIVVELPRFRLQSARANTDITVWIRSLLPDGTQFDRTGRPGINTVVGFAQPLAGLPDISDLFNSLSPSDDPGLRGAAAQRINLAFGLPIDQANSLANILLPDTLDFNTTNRDGFLNGRRLQDDVIDAELGLLTGGALTSDRVINDSVFSTRFPYIGPPLPRSSIRAAIRTLSRAP